MRRRPEECIGRALKTQASFRGLHMLEAPDVVARAIRAFVLNP
jgi:hypothetical protein